MSKAICCVSCALTVTAKNNAKQDVVIKVFICEANSFANETPSAKNEFHSDQALNAAGFIPVHGAWFEWLQQLADLRALRRLRAIYGKKSGACARAYHVLVGEELFGAEGSGKHRHHTGP